jgi:hypothetical protein
MIDTPLFVTLLCVAYRAEQYIPDTTHEFYDLVFNTLLYRHDAFKPGFDRPRKSSLGNSQFCKVFENFCFLSLKEQVVRMTEEKANLLINESLKNENITSTDSDKYFSDLVKITCLLVQDGAEYQFLHKSIQDYFCAKYIERLPDEVAFKFYYKILRSSDLLRIFNQVLRFLKGIDTYRYSKHFELPAISYVFFGDYEWENKNFDKIYSFDGVFDIVGGDDAALSFSAPSDLRALYWSGNVNNNLIHSLAAYLGIPEMIANILFSIFNSDSVKSKLSGLKADPEIASRFSIDTNSSEMIVSVKKTVIKLRLKKKFSELFLSDSVFLEFSKSINSIVGFIDKKDALSKRLDLF